MEYNSEYCDLLKQNTNYHVKVRSGKSSYASYDYLEMQSKLLQIEVAMSSEDIVAHAAYCFPSIGNAI